MKGAVPVRKPWLGEPLDIRSAGPVRLRRDRPDVRRRRRRGFVKETLVVFVGALVLSFLLKTFLVQPFLIPSGSMEATLVNGDRVLVNKLVPGPFDLSRGDVVVFEDPGGWQAESTPPDRSPVASAAQTALAFIGVVPPENGSFLIKRIVGLPGDTVECCDAQGRLLVNGEPIDETYVYPGDNPSDIKFKVTVPDGHLWVLGDHRSDSRDSRYNSANNDGMVPIDNVVGVAFIIVWPFSSWSMLSNPGDVFADVPDPS